MLLAPVAMAGGEADNDVDLHTSLVAWLPCCELLVHGYKVVTRCCSLVVSTEACVRACVRARVCVNQHTRGSRS